MYRDHLLKYNYDYLDISYAGKRINNHGVVIESIFSDEPELFDYNIREGLYGSELEEHINKAKKELTNLITSSECDNIILSGEAISTLKKNELVKLKKYLDSLQCNYKVLCSVRTPYSFMCSDHQEVIKINNASVENVFVREKFQHTVKLKEVFLDKIEYYSFIDSCKWHKGVTNYFLNFINCKELPDSLKEVRSNNGLNNLSTRLYSFLNVKHPNIVDGKLNPLGRGFNTIDLDDNKFLLTERELHKVRSELDNENKLFKDSFGGDYCDATYPTAEETKISIIQSYEAYNFHRNSNLAESILLFVELYRDFEWDELIDYAYQKEDADILRDIALYEITSKDLATKSIVRALILRPKGKVINKLALSIT
ncbi:hypothetical protein FCV55_16220 [Vibrio sp. F13]|uniref:hypothetical protein n=1 Tax=Vibrio sp. F13 TaxID=2070777 RepID=UPI0010BDBA35|nr:hypothetical protein [Vibrio sp. F13]TKF67360.1 hypothetical protein FCV55_16220 [Vibrio sp. F13]